MRFSHSGAPGVVATVTAAAHTARVTAAIKRFVFMGDGSDQGDAAGLRMHKC